MALGIRGERGQASFGWVALGALCWMVFVFGANANVLAQSAEVHAPNELVAGQVESQVQSEGSSSKQAKLTVGDLKRLSAGSQAVLASVAESVVAMNGGSGVIVSRDGWVLTASHVCERPGRRIQVRLANGIEWPAKTYGVDRQKDTGMAKLLGDHVWPFVPVDQDAAVEPGDWCVVMGYPWDTETLKTPAVRLGRVTEVGDSRIVTDVPIIGGDSGGPVFDINGQLLAVSSRIRLDVNQNIHIPVATYVRQFDALKREGFVRTVDVKKNGPIDVSLAQKLGRNTAEVQDAVVDLVVKSKPSVVRLAPVRQDESDGVASKKVLGTVVDKSGLVVAKHSELRLPQKALVEGDWMEAEMVSFDSETDVALLQLKPKAPREFVPIQANADVANAKLVGRLVLSLVGNEEDASLMASVGTVMVAPQKFSETVARQEVDLGLVLASKKSRRSRQTGAEISRVYPKSLVEQAGLRSGDRLVSIDGRDVVDEAGLKQVLTTVVGGQKIRFSILRRSELLSFRVQLPVRLPLVWDRWGGGPFSQRRFGFGTVIAHDAVIDPSDCGGPVVDLDGNFLGINVSRAMRTTTYVVPAAKLQALVQKHQQSQ